MKFKAPRYPRPRWSARTSFAVALGIIATTAPIVLFLIRKSIWEELEVVTGAVACALFVYFSVILYLGVRFDADRKAHIEWPVGRPADFADAVSFVPGDGFFTELGSEGGCLGMLLGFLLDLVAALVIAVVVAAVLWLGVNAMVALFIPLFFLHRRFLRYVVTRGRHCRGQAGRSLFHGLASAALYTCWFYAIFFLAHTIHERRTFMNSVPAGAKVSHHGFRQAVPTAFSRFALNKAR